MSLIRVESALKRRDEDLYAKYSVVKDDLLTNLQSRWCSHWEEGNDHGPDHIKRVLVNLGNLLGEAALRQHSKIGTLELFLSMVAIVAHDIGIPIKCRE